jgi:hypothetical protein
VGCKEEVRRVRVGVRAGVLLAVVGGVRVGMHQGLIILGIPTRDLNLGKEWVWGSVKG